MHEQLGKVWVGEAQLRLPMQLTMPRCPNCSTCAATSTWPGPPGRLR